MAAGLFDVDFDPCIHPREAPERGTRKRHPKEAPERHLRPSPPFTTKPPSAFFSGSLGRDWISPQTHIHTHTRARATLFSGELHVLTPTWYHGSNWDRDKGGQRQGEGGIKTLRVRCEAPAARGTTCTRVPNHMYANTRLAPNVVLILIVNGSRWTQRWGSRMGGCEGLWVLSYLCHPVLPIVST